MLSLQIKLGTFSSTLLEGVRSTPYLSRRYKSKRRALPSASVHGALPLTREVPRTPLIR